MRTRRQLGVSAVMALGFMAATMLTASPVQAASGNGPYYAEPAWSQKLPAATRFVVLTDWNSEAVLDRETGLVWDQSPTTSTHGWNNARTECTGRATGNRKGWRLPSVHELASLIDSSVPSPGPTLPLGYPFTNVQSNFYWSATTAANIPAAAWVVNFGTRDVNTNGKTNIGQIWCVRGGNNADAY